MMKIYSFFLLLLLAYHPMSAQLKTPAMNPAAFVKQNVGLTEITLSYARPSVRGREIFGENGILAFGHIWRMGANAATKISFSSAVDIMDHSIKKGEYAVLALPQADNWTLTWYAHESSNWSTYIEKDPLYEMKVSVIPVATPVETMELHLEEITLDQATLTFEWEHVKWQVPIRVPTKEATLQSIARTMEGPSRGEYFQAAVYLHDSGEDLDKALTYIQAVTQLDNARFFEVTREAQILRDLGKNAEAVEVAKKGLELSKAAKNHDFVLLNTRLIQTFEK